MTTEDPVGDRGRCIDSCLTLGGEMDMGCDFGLGDPDGIIGVLETGRDRRYQPPVYVKAIS